MVHISAHNNNLTTVNISCVKEISNKQLKLISSIFFHILLCGLKTIDFNKKRFK